jgi:SAM-dependent methyltransferase
VECLPTDSARQTTAMDYARMLAPGLPDGAVVLDVGCGTGISLDLFTSLAPRSHWVGVDIEGSPEVLSRTRPDGDFRTFDGIDIPLRDASVDLVYSRQVFEHVRQPEPLLADIRRVLRPGGAFIGSTSHLEPYHSHSLWNYTPVGFKRLVIDAGMRVRELRPGIDGISLIKRAYERRDEMNHWFTNESPLNQEIDEWAREGRHSVAVTAYRKLSFCGQFAFWVERPA